MGVNKVTINNSDGEEEVIVDLSGDTVKPETLAEGVTAHGADGEPIVGTMSVGGSSKAIIDVVELPTENIDEDSFYRLLTGTFYYNGTPQADWTCYIVESLPSEGVPVTTDMVHVSLYYATDTGAVTGYVNSALSGAIGVPVGWYPVEALAHAFGLAWGGIIWSEFDDPVDGANRLLLSYALYQFKRDWNNISERVGWRGEASGAEIFNTLKNVASGSTSHAEGSDTIASGNSSHAEGYRTTASGEDSHAEGEFTEATKRGQHVQGRFNILDDFVEDESRYGKYAHIVGNGNNIESRSNAHTLDWQGNAWFAGDIKVGGTGQDDENAKTLATTEYVDSKIPKDSVVGTWLLNENLNITLEGNYFCRFWVKDYDSDDGNSFEGFLFAPESNVMSYLLDQEGQSVIDWYEEGEWYNTQRAIVITEQPTDAEFITWLKANATKQLVDLSNLATVDKVKSIDTWSEGVSELTADDGISWREGFIFYDDTELSGNKIAWGDIHHRMPIVAGENINFEATEDGLCVIINATGGGTSDNVVMNYKVEVEGSTTVVDMIATIQGMGADISKFNVVTLYGYQSTTLGMQINHYGGNVYNINAIDLMSGNTLSNTRDWLSVGIGDFLVMFEGGGNDANVDEIVQAVIDALPKYDGEVIEV